MTSNGDNLLCTTAEERARQAEGLESIGNFNLESIKRAVAQILGAIGGSNIFGEYTKHDISHINEMLRLLDWIVPEETKRAMTAADWLLVVLGVYFHDLGMCVTEREYEARHKSNFPDFKNKNLFAGPRSGDYKIKVATLGEDMAERFFYQEFIRYNHAARIRAWLAGVPSQQYGVTSVSQEISTLVGNFGEQFRDDLGVICESHHLDDLDNLKKYNIARAYGRTDAEMANIQYAAILLRTADILHMTKDRTPSVMYRLINPSDPISQREWRKQMGVNRVLGKPGRDLDGNVSDSALRDTVEIHAYFNEAEPFFALSSFLNYTEQQLQLCNQWTEKARNAGAKSKFPWRWIDREQIVAKGFLSKVFAFELDQPKILNLLTGHTLYNDSGVVLRELVQNSIDAVKLQRHQDTLLNRPDSTHAGVTIEWKKSERVLLVEDVGTGMTQEIIEAHLLRVGSSRYSTEKFKEQYPDFWPISRFGIGILTAFMISDEVDIFTCHPDESDARHIILRNLHGKYLIKLVSKRESELQSIVPHGTRIKLKLRPSAKIADIEGILRTWIVVPGCTVTLRSAGRPDSAIGHRTLKQALEETLLKAEVSIAENPIPRQGDVKVFSYKRGFADVAFACKWSETFKEWELLSFSNQTSRAMRKNPFQMGICIEGIRVEFGAAGYRNSSLALMSNATGAGAPRTNVARSGLEKTSESKELNRHVYESLFEYLRDEVEQVRTRRRLSATGALSEGRFLLAPLLDNPSDTDTFEDCIKDLPLLLVEERGTRRAITPRQLESHDTIWTIDCPLFYSAEDLLRTAGSDASLSNIVKTLADSNFPNEPILCRGGLDDEWALGTRGVDRLILNSEMRRVDLRWKLGAKDHYWKGLSAEATRRAHDLPQVRYFEDRRDVRGASIHKIFVSVGGRAEGANGEICVRTAGTLYILPDNQLVDLIKLAIETIEKSSNDDSIIVSTGTMKLLRLALTQRYSIFEESSVARFLDQPRAGLSELADVRAITNALNELRAPDRIFDTTYSRRSPNNTDEEFGL